MTKRKRNGEDTTASGMYGDSPGFREAEAQAGETGVQKSRCKFYRNFWSKTVSSPIRFKVTAADHQSPSPTLSLSSIKKLKHSSTQYSSHACYMPDNVQGSMTMQNQTDMLPSLGT